MKTIAIYHKDCVDGTTAAAVLLKKFPHAILFPLGHGYESHELEPVLKLIEKGDAIYSVDCAIGMKEILALGHKMTVIDHHAGIEDELLTIAKTSPDLTYIFDNDKSGASLSWAHFFPDIEMPEVIRYVEDNDLWKQRYGDDTKNVVNYLFMLVNEPHEFLRYFDEPLDEIKRYGAVITKFLRLRIDHAVKSTEPVNIAVGVHKVPFYNITEEKSSAGNILSIERSQAVGLYSIDGEKLKISFRSTDDNSPSALELAQALNGGGHKNAAGASMSLQEFIDKLKDR